MRHIKILDKITIAKIAAGEVIQRPSSAIKELIENAIDADASSIEVCIEDAGKTLIQVRDNGCGMQKDDLEIALLAHSTSKLTDDAFDMFNIRTFGFRGEALHSMSACANVSITSTLKDAPHGWRLRAMAGSIEPLEQCDNTKQGTMIQVLDLFANMPARLKFVKSNICEMMSIKQIIQHYAISNPSISITLHADNRQILQYDHADDFSQRAKQVLGVHFYQNCLPINHHNELFTLKGYVSMPSYYASNSSKIWIFANNRPVSHKAIVSTLRRAYGDLIPSKTYPHAIMMINLPMQMVDVNVHPAKSEIRIYQENKLLSFVHQTVKATLASNQDSAPHLENDLFNALERNKECETETGGQNLAQDYSDDSTSSTNKHLHLHEAATPYDSASHEATHSCAQYHSKYHTAHHHHSARGWAQDYSDDSDGGNYDYSDDSTSSTNKHLHLHEADTPYDSASHEATHSCAQYHSKYHTAHHHHSAHDWAQDYSDGGGSGDSGSGSGVNSSSYPAPKKIYAHGDLQLEPNQEPLDHQKPLAPDNIIPLAQLHQKYILAQTKDGLIVIDQHALAERILFEELKALCAHLPLEQQILVDPIRLNLHNNIADIDTVLAAMSEIGMQSAVKDNALHVYSFPNFLIKYATPDFIHQLLEGALGAKDIQQLINNICSSLACHNSLRSGQVLSIHEMDYYCKILEKKDQRFFHCNHGRPSHIRLPLPDIDRLFRRT